jgi:hypothetical protein
MHWFQNVLWNIFTFYVIDKILIPSSTASELKRHRKPLLSGASMKALFENFGLCPNICRYDFMTT